MEPDAGQWTFKGFSSPNFTTVPDEFFDDLAPRLTGAELKVVLYIIRRTFGFKKQSDNISISQMLNGIVKRDGQRLDLGAGLSKPTLMVAIRGLTEKRVILPTKQFDFKGGCIATNYRLNMANTAPDEGARYSDRAKAASAGEESSSAGEGQGTPGKKIIQGGESRNLTRPLVKKRYPQDTVIQDTDSVNVSIKAKRRSALHDLPDREQPPELTELIAADILDVLHDDHSATFYRLVARKIPEGFIRKTLAELKEGHAASPARVFTSTMTEYAERAREPKSETDIDDSRRALARRFRNG
jgi:hypothetical protein